MASTRRSRPKTPAPTSHEWRRYALPAFLTGVFALKLIVVMQLRHQPLLQPDAGLDTTAYVTLAQKVLAGNWLLGPGQYFVSPLYIYFVAAGLALTHSFTAIRIAQVALGTAAVALVFATTRAWFTPRAAWIAAGAAALTGMFTFYETLLIQSSLDPVLTAAALLCVTFALTRRGTPWWILAGVIFGIQTLNRPNVAIAAGGIVVLLLAIRRVRPAGWLVAGLVIGLAPAIVRNAIVTGTFSLPSSHGGLNLYIGNSEGAGGGYHDIPGIDPTIEGQERDAKLVAEKALGHPLTDGQVSGYFTGLALSWMRSHPGTAIGLFLKKIAFTLNAAHSSLDFSYPFYAHDVGSILGVCAVEPWLLVPLGLVGLVIAAPRERRADYLVFVSFVPLYIVAVAIFFVSDRYRLPLLVPLCIGAGAAVDIAVTTVAARHTRQLAAAGAAFLVLAVGANWQFHLDDGRADQRLRMAGTMISLGRFDEGERWADLAVRIHPKPSLAHFRVGGWMLLAHQPARALPHLVTANALDPNQPPVEYALGQALLGVNRAAEALPLLERGIDGGVGAEVHLANFDLARALEATGDIAGAGRLIPALVPGPDDDVQVWLSIGRLAAEVKQPVLAEPYFRHAVAMRPDLASAHEQLALDLLVLNRVEEAAREFSAAVQIDPHAANSLAYLAVCDSKLGRPDDARLHAQQALQLDPSSAIARQVLASLGR